MPNPFAAKVPAVHPPFFAKPAVMPDARYYTGYRRPVMSK
jgi:hypothetical protein